MIFSVDLYSMEHNTFGWLSERGDNFFNLLQKEGGTQKGGGGGSLRKGRFPNLEETMVSTILAAITFKH